MRLRRGQRFTLEGIEYKVMSVNESRAYCVPTQAGTREVKGKKFAVTARGINISPNSEVA